MALEDLAEVSVVADSHGISDLIDELSCAAEKFLGMFYAHKRYILGQIAACFTLEKGTEVSGTESHSISHRAQ